MSFRFEYRDLRENICLSRDGGGRMGKRHGNECNIGIKWLDGIGVKVLRLVWIDVAANKRLKEENFILDSQLTHTCSKLTIETLEKGMKYVQS